MTVDFADISRLVRPFRVAVIGASDRVGSFGHSTYDNVRNNSAIPGGAAIAHRGLDGAVEGAERVSEGAWRKAPGNQLRAVVADHLMAGLGMQFDGDRVTHRAGGHEHCGFFAHDFGCPPLQAVRPRTVALPIP